MENNLNIRELTVKDVENYAEHIIRHVYESGEGNAPIFTPVAVPPSKQEIVLNKETRWPINPGEGNWGKCWGVFFGKQIIGHLDLTGNALISLIHRADLSMGIESSFRGHGIGKVLMEMAIEWSYAQSFLEYIDLGVFNNNIRAKELYTSFGFEQIGIIPDRVRIQGKNIDDLIMALNLGKMRNEQEACSSFSL